MKFLRNLFKKKRLVYAMELHGIERKKYSDFKIFRKFKDAEKWVEEDYPKKGLECFSTSGWSAPFEHWIDDKVAIKTVGAFTDWRCEDKDGNTYYYVIQVQELN